VWLKGVALLFIAVRDGKMVLLLVTPLKEELSGTLRVGTTEVYEALFPTIPICPFMTLLVLPFSDWPDLLLARKVSRMTGTRERAMRLTRSALLLMLRLLRSSLLLVLLFPLL